MLIPVAVSMYALLIPGVAVYIRIKRKGTGKDNAAVISKGLCSTVVLAAGAIGLANVPEEYNIYALLIVAGLALGLAGDIAICNNFLAGMVYFAIGHLCYIPAFLSISEAPLWALPVFAVVYLISIVLYRKSGINAEHYLIPVIVYSIIITIMFSLAVSVTISKPQEPAGWVVLAGALLFTIADMLLAHNVFSKKGSRLRKAVVNRLGGISTFCYFIGQSILAVSIFFF